MTGSEFSAASERYRKAVEKELERIASEDTRGVYPKLRDAMFYSVEGGGKRLRPCLVLAVCEMLGGDIQNALPIACALEMIHTYSLIHDDLPCMDDDDMRRGRPSNHKVFGEAMAVLAGDGLLSFAFEIMLAHALKTGDRGVLAAACEVALRAGARGMVTGQAADIEYEGSRITTEETLRFIHRHKTADMLEAAVAAGALTAGADDDTLRALRLYSEKMGLLFQITDDILDVSGDPALMGKTLGKDAEQGKLTYVGLLGLEGAQKAAARAAEEAKDAVRGVKENGYLSALIDKMLIRNN